MDSVMVSIRKHNGLVFKNIEYKRPIDGACSIGDDRFVARGFCSVTILTGDSVKFGKQLQFNFYAPKGSFKPEERTKDNIPYDRIEFFIPLAEGLELIKQMDILRKEEAE